MSFAYNHQVANENEQVFFGLKPRISKKHENTRQAANVNPLHRYFWPQPSILQKQDGFLIF